MDQAATLMGLAHGHGIKRVLECSDGYGSPFALLLAVSRTYAVTAGAFGWIFRFNIHWSRSVA